MSKTNTAPTAKLALKGTIYGSTTSPVHAHEWDLPTQQADGSWAPGKWSAVKGTIEYRKRGLHVAMPDQIAYWQGHLKGKRMIVWVCEYDGNTSIGMHGFAARRVRLLRPWMGEAL